jgi:hypothetical protein
LTGTGILPATLSATSLAFGNVGAGSPSAAQTLTLTNSQTVALNITSITKSGAYGGDFGISGTCVTLPSQSLAAKGACTIILTFTPSIVGAESTTLSVNDSASNTPQTAVLTGTGIAPATLSATSLAFGNVAEGSPSSAQTLTLTNSQTVALNITSITKSGAYAGDFGTSGTCVGLASLAAKGTCTIILTFTPSIVGPESTTLSVNDSASNTPQTAVLTGTGVL